MLLAAILTGGFGKRLKPYTDEVPKSLIEICGKPILEWQIEWLKSHGFNEIVLLVGYKKEKIIEYFGSGSRFGVRITYIVEDEPLGTGGAVRNAEHVLSKTGVFLLLNGDVLTNLDPKKLVGKLNEGYLGVLATIPLPSPYGVLEIEDSRVKGFIEKPHIREYWINAGIYALSSDALKFFPERGDLERTAFPEMAKKGLLGAVKYEGIFWKSIDTFKDIEEASKALEALAGKL